MPLLKSHPTKVRRNGCAVDAKFVPQIGLTSEQDADGYLKRCAIHVKWVRKNDSLLFPNCTRTISIMQRESLLTLDTSALVQDGTLLKKH